MRMEEVFQLQDTWKKKGNPPCKHAVVDSKWVTTLSACAFSPRPQERIWPTLADL
jgi:hypothetical protein